MGQPHIQDLTLLDWQSHPTIKSVLTKVFENAVTHPLADALLAQVEVGGDIPWHVHEQASETAYALVGEGILRYAESDKRDHPSEAQLKTGMALTSLSVGGIPF